MQLKIMGSVLTSAAHILRLWEAKGNYEGRKSKSNRN